jgi:hypothetical protein
VATDQKAITAGAGATSAEPVIENEIPTYRAINRKAIFSLACGLLSVCTFAHPAFYAFALLAIGLGILAQRDIRRYPDMFTGSGLANAGITMGLIFGLFAATVSSVQYFVRKRQAEEFAKKYAEILKTPSLGDVLWYQTHPDLRKDKTGAQLLKDHESRPKERQMMEAHMGPLAQLTALRDRLASSKSEEIHFVRIEAVGEDDSHGGSEIPIFALALYEINGPANEKFPDKKQYALVILKARPSGREYEWWAESVRFPYVPESYAPAEHPVDDGHGHSHAGDAH